MKAPSFLPNRDPSEALGGHPSPVRSSNVRGSNPVKLLAALSTALVSVSFSALQAANAPQSAPGFYPVLGGASLGFPTEWGALSEWIGSDIDVYPTHSSRVRGGAGRLPWGRFANASAGGTAKSGAVGTSESGLVGVAFHESDFTRPDRVELIPAAAFAHTEADAQRAQAIASGQERLLVPVAGSPGPHAATTSREEWSEGPWLLLDERNVLSVDHLRRVLGQPVRHGAPIVDGATDGNFQPYVSVVEDPVSGRWRMWYNVPRTPANAGESSLALIESEDGIHWQRPHRVLVTAPIQFGASVIDEGPAFTEKAKRFKAAWHKNNGLQVSTSPDGIIWTELAPGPLLQHNHDIDAIDWDPIRRRYMAFVSFATKLDPAWVEPRRIPHMSTSEDLLHWRQPWVIISPDPASPREQGDTQFYCMAGVIARGRLLIGLAKVLRDDLNAEIGLTAKDLGDTRPYAGIGYTVLAWSADGEHWRRDTEPFLDRNPQPGTWDRAHAWGDEQVVHGDEVFLYYGGYGLGHKAERFTTRQIGLARLKLDRYAGYTAAGEHPGVLRTAIRTLNGHSLTVNADIRGELRVALCEPSGKFLPGFSFDECGPVRGDQVAHPIRWKHSDPAQLQLRRVQIVFQVKDGTVYAFSVH